MWESGIYAQWSKPYQYSSETGLTWHESPRDFECLDELRLAVYETHLNFPKTVRCYVISVERSQQEK